MKRSTVITALATLTVAGLALAGCAPAATDETPAEKPVVSIITIAYAIPTAKVVLDEVVAQGEAEGWDVQISDSAGDFNKAIGFYQDAAVSDVDAIVNGFVSSSLIGPGLQAAKDAGIPVYGFDASSEADPLHDLVVTSDNTAIGVVAAEAIIDAVGEPGTVLIVTYSPLPSIAERTQGAIDTFEAAGWEVKQTLDLTGPVTAAEETTNFVTDVLTANPAPGAIDAIWTPGAEFAGIPAAETLTRLGREDVIVSGVDTSDAVTAAIKSGGPLKFTVEQDFAGQITAIIDAIKAQLKDGTKPAKPFIKFAPKLLSIDNIDD
ncbi:MAG TPA: sugar ABC transporter substrate-binding protein [Pseudolysinimonas sp.]|nr:sugar ABC transporter substrate-binding protein [Pseudolysinimonas sp.]